LVGARTGLEDMEESEFKRYVSSCVHANCQAPHKLKTDSKQMWDEVSSHCYGFGEALRMQAGLEALTKADVLDLMEKIFITDAKRLEIQIISEDHWKSAKKALGKREHFKLYNIEKWHKESDDFYTNKYSITN